ncbi:MAG: hypothetical protein ACOCRN_01645 [Spirochaetia bacterium]
MRRALLRVSLSSLLLTAAGCTGEGPDIHQLRHSTIAVHDIESDSRQEALSVFAHATHPHSFEDLELLQLKHEESQLEWQLQRDNWMLREWDDRLFVGATGFYAPGGESLPRGTYELTIEDIGGRSAETQFEVRTLDFSLERAEFPTLERAGARNEGLEQNDAGTPREFRVTPSYDELVVTARDADDRIAGRYIGEEFDFSLDDLEPDDGSDYSIEGLRLFVQAHLQRSQVWLISGPWRIGDL